MLETKCAACHEWTLLDAASVVLGRRFPQCDGSVTYCCFRCGTPQAMFLDADAVLFSMLSGVPAVDIDAASYHPDPEW